MNPDKKREPPPKPEFKIAKISNDTFSQDLKYAVNNPLYSDIHFIFKDGGVLYGHKILLRCSGSRLEYLNSFGLGFEIFIKLVTESVKNEMIVDLKEEKVEDHVITKAYVAEDYSFHLMKELFRFLYTGDVSGITLEISNQLKSLAKKLNLAHLEELLEKGRVG